MSGVTITTYTMVSFSGRRSEESQKASPQSTITSTRLLSPIEFLAL